MRLVSSVIGVNVLFGEICCLKLRGLKRFWGDSCLNQVRKLDLSHRSNL
ncbi:hypothetical protein ES705_34080 [subsurface metagenome]